MNATLAELLAGLDVVGAPAGLDRVLATAVTIDSRRVRPGTVFVACPGATPSSKDGHEFLAQAASAGAVALVVTDPARAKDAGSVPVIVVRDARRAAALLAERVHGSPSSSLQVVGITGTNGKTTATWLLAQLCAHAGRKAAVLGTLGAGPVEAPRSFGYTTPEAEVLSAELARLRDEGFSVVAMEVSSHALATARVDGVRFAAAGFTNLTRDHLDFHGDMDAYFAAKLRLFTELAPRAPATVPARDEDGWASRLLAARPDRLAYSVSATATATSGASLHVESVAARPDGTSGVLVHRSAAGAIERAPFSSPLLGGYNVENILVAAGCALGVGLSLAEVAAGLASATAPPGRLQRVDGGDGAPLVVVDYAHTPDALERALHVVRGVTADKLIAVFGCGGDRDPGKRPLMGRIAGECADAVIVTDDNPRSEDGDRIVDAALAGVVGKTLVPADQLRPGTVAKERSRRMAIRVAIAAADEGDAVLIAGKGHERTQTIGARVLPFDDVTEAQRALRGEASPAFLDAAFVKDALAGRRVQVRGEPPPVLLGVVTDSRALGPVGSQSGALFVALAGERFDGHAFVKDVLAAGRAGAALVQDRPELAGTAPVFVVDDTLLALQDLARAHVARLPARRVALTGSNGKTTTKELIAASLRAALGAPYVLATEGNLNNHIGVPLTVLQAEPEHRALVIEMGMNHLGEIALLADIVRPEVGLITNIGTAHAGNVGGVEGVAVAKAELFAALGKDGVAVVNADDPRCLREAQRAAKCRHITFGKASWADVRLAAVHDRETGGQELVIAYGAASVETSIPLEGRHNADNAVGAVATAVALGLPFEACARGVASMQRAHGRLERFVLPNGAWLLDDTYNANPDSMEAALRALVDLAGSSKRKLVVLGEMRELGALAEQAHRHIGAGVTQSGAALLFACGELGRLYGDGAVRNGLPAGNFVWAADNASLAPLVAARVEPADVVLVKGSRGARMEVVVAALRKQPDDAGGKA